jgi:DNA invertase Pin-like site-specific DNA recombinase
MRVGYARVSRKDQKLEPQRDALLADGCERVFEEKISSREAERGALLEAFDYCREGEHSVEEICSMLGVGRSTLYRYLADGSSEG